MSPASPEAPEWFTKALARPSEARRVQVLGRDVAYRLWPGPDSPTAPGLLLIHGSAAHGRWWDFIAGQLDGDFRLAAMDLPGMGDSDPHETYSRDTFAEAVRAVCEHAGLTDGRNAWLVGHSFGGAAALFGLRNHPDLAAGLVLVDTPIRPPNHDYSRHRSSAPVRAVRPYPTKEAILGRFRVVPPQPPLAPWIHAWIAEHSVRHDPELGGWCWKYDDKVFAGMTDERYRRHEDLEARLSCHLCLIYGTRSMLMPAPVVDYMKMTLEMQAKAQGRHFSLVPMEGLYHHLILEDPQGFAAVLAEQIRLMEAAPS